MTTFVLRLTRNASCVSCGLRILDCACPDLERRLEEVGAEGKVDVGEVLASVRVARATARPS